MPGPFSHNVSNQRQKKQQRELQRSDARTNLSPVELEWPNNQDHEEARSGQKTGRIVLSVAEPRDGNRAI